MGAACAFAFGAAGCAGEPTACDRAWYADADGDGFGHPTFTLVSCEAPPGFVAVAGDCDDGDARRWPAAPEDCASDIDLDCDGRSPRDDDDGDGTPGCEDCDDADPAVRPHANELCNGRDDDCDGRIDDEPVDAPRQYPDDDADGYGDRARETSACEPLAGHVLAVGDCDDTSADVHPGAAERCNWRDDNCDGAVDEAGAEGAVRVWEDADGDGWGAIGAWVETCVVLPGAVLVGEDCDDGDAGVHPGASELCNGVDDDCDGGEDGADAVGAVVWYRDRDLDGAGDTSSPRLECEQPLGWAAIGGDCDDLDSRLSPLVDELCNEVDDDCDGVIDEGDAVDAGTWYTDLDGDGHGDDATAVTDCAGVGYVSVGSDCDDADASVWPDAPERCNGVDDDCDGGVDDAAVDAPTWYIDGDGDGAGSTPGTVQDCDQPAGHAPAGDDCDDEDADISPAAAERCNQVDDDCDGVVDEDAAADAPTWFEDRDGDGWGGATATTQACEQPAGYSSSPEDCDDGQAAVHPGSIAEDCADPLDYNCDGSTGYMDNDGDGVAACEDCDDRDPSASDRRVWLFADLDGDGYGDPGVSEEVCGVGPRWVADDTDCDDTRAGSNPGATEECDGGVDDDCDGDVDEAGALGCETWAFDADEDGFGSTSARCLCEATGFWTASTTDDCDDGEPAVNPGVPEQLGNATDDDCDGDVDVVPLGSEAGLIGTSLNDGVGSRFTFGDLDGDGLSDLVAYSSENDEGWSNAGAAWVLYAGERRPVTTADADVVLSGEADRESLGSAAAVDDLDRDGVGELLVGASGRGGTGAVAVFSGPVASGTASDAAVLIEGVAGNDYVGQSVCAPGDLDGDGIRDYVVGGWGYGANGGIAVFDSLAGGPYAFDAGLALVEGDVGAKIGGEAWPAGDTNGDGLPDVAVVARAATVSYAYVLEGPITSGLVTTVGEAVDPPDLSEGSGETLSGVGDIDGDGYEDIHWGEYEVGASGALYVLFGPFTGGHSFADAEIVLEGGEMDCLGFAPLAVGDVGGDGEPDLVAGSLCGADAGMYSGSTWVIPGSTRGVVVVDDVASATIVGSPGSDSGTWLGVTDFDGDDVLDLGIGTPGMGMLGRGAGAIWLVPTW